MPNGVSERRALVWKQDLLYHFGSAQKDTTGQETRLHDFLCRFYTDGLMIWAVFSTHYVALAVYYVVAALTQFSQKCYLCCFWSQCFNCCQPRIWENPLHGNFLYFCSGVLMHLFIRIPKFIQCTSSAYHGNCLRSPPWNSSPVFWMQHFTFQFIHHILKCCLLFFFAVLLHQRDPIEARRNTTVSVYKDPGRLVNISLKGSSIMQRSM